MRPPPLAVVLLCGIALAVARHPLPLDDHFWHLSVGRWIVERGEIPWLDTFTFSVPGKPWVPHSIGWALLLQGIEALGGLAALRSLVGLLVAVSGLTLLELLLEKGGARYRLATWLLAPVLVAYLELAMPRPYWIPQILLPVLWLWIDRTLRAGDRDPLPGLGRYFAVAWLWAFGHASMVLAIAAPVLAASLDGDRRRRRHLLAAAGLAGVASLLQPNGPWVWLEIWNHIWHQPSVSGFVQEWEAPTLAGLTLVVNLILVLLVAITAAGRRQGPRWELAWGLLWLAGYLVNLRHLGLAVMAWAVLAMEAAAPMVADRGWFAEDAPPAFPRRDRRWIAAFAALLLGAHAAGFPGLGRKDVDQGELPTRELDPFFAATPLRRILYRFEWGGYVSWRTRHRVPCFMDGRLFLFGTGMIRDYLAILQGDPGWEAIFDRYAFDGVLLIENAACLDRILARPGWSEAPRPHPALRLLVRREP